MPSFALVSTVLSLAAVASAQAGRYPCSQIVNGAVQENAAACVGLTGPGTSEGPSTAIYKYDGFTPAGNVQCILDPDSPNYFCGWIGATCTTANSGTAQSECDNGLCIGGTCQGYFTQSCGSNDFNCLGNLYCTNDAGATTVSDTCGGQGAFCQDFNVGGLSTDAANEAQFDTLCNSGYCNFGTGNCDVHVALGGDCSSDPEFGCGAGLTCTTNADSTQTCQTTIVPSGRARARRNEQLNKKSLCPASHTACAISTGKRGFECIDTQSNLEQCGTCASSGGVDCTTLPGVEAVGCVAGQCEIWACSEGFAWDASTESCAVALVL